MRPYMSGSRHGGHAGRTECCAEVGAPDPSPSAPFRSTHRTARDDRRAGKRGRRDERGGRMAMRPYRRAAGTVGRRFCLT